MQKKSYHNREYLIICEISAKKMSIFLSKVFSTMGYFRKMGGGANIRKKFTLP